MDSKQLESVHYAEMLYQLKSTVEGLLDCQSTNVWNIYGGLNRLHSIIAKIFKHGFRIYKPNGEADCWIFIQGLSWLQPTLAASPSFVGNHISRLKSPVRNYDKAMIWLYKSIENHKLSEKLCWLLSDQEHLVSCYNPTAYLRQARYSEATLICLRAVEQNQPSFLTDIDPTLYLRKKLATPPNKSHRRSQSYPERKINDVLTHSVSVISNVDPSSNEPTIIDDTSSTTCFVRLGKTSSSIDNRRRGRFPSSTAQPQQQMNYKMLNLEMLESIFKPTDEEINAKNHLKQRLLKRNFSALDLLLADHDDKTSACQSSNNDDRRRCQSFTSGVRCRSSKQAAGVKTVIIERGTTTLDDILKVDYSNETFITTKIDSSANSLFSSTSSVNTLIADIVVDGCNGKQQNDKRKSKNNNNNYNNNKRRRRKRSSSIFKLPFRIWEESSDDETANSICSDGSRTLVPGGNGSSIGVDSVSILPKKKSFIEDNGNIVLPMSIGFFPRPSPGQSLISFLSSGVFTHATAELDRENAHFSISEAMIATIEQVKCNHQLSNADEMLEESDEEINALKRTIRMRRIQKQKEKQVYSDSAFFSSETNDTLTTDQSVNSLSSSVYSTSESISTDTEYEHDLLAAKKSGLSVSKLSIYSDQSSSSSHCKADISTSAESVAISLLRRFNENQLPAASEIEWLVSENDAPQKILPLPSDITISSDERNGEDSNSNTNTLLRGTSEWAPPRPQIIFTPHPPPVRKVLMEKQRYRCAGCSMKVAPKYACKFRYCAYLGRYFCTDCHSEKTSIIPGRVLYKWDFTKCPVSNFSFTLLDQMSTDPLFNVSDLNPILYEKNRTLKKIRLYRFQLMFLKDFIFTCKYAERLNQSLKREEPHLLADPDCYSLQDLVQVRNGKLLTWLADIVKQSINHVNSCQFCQMHGFICELCNDSKSIFPWDLERIHRCNKCGSCYHVKCFTKIRICPKCLRRSNRHDRWNCIQADDG